MVTLNWNYSQTCARPMIDYLRCRLPINLPRPINNGHTVKVDQNGNVLSATPHRLPVLGSFEAVLHVRSVTPTELEIEGNPAKWLQGHNLYGTDDLPMLLWATLARILPLLGTSLAECGLNSIDDVASAIITRVDVTYMLHLDTPSDVLSWIRSAYSNGRANRRGRGVMRGDTLVFGDAQGKNFTRWQIVIYSKGQEINAHPLPQVMMQDAEVLEWVNKALRVEVRLGRLELEKQGLRNLHGWNPGMGRDVKGCDPAAIWRAKVAQLDFNTSAEAHYDLEKLPRNLRAIFVAWRSGADVRTMLSRPTYYRHRAKLQELTGVDIAVPPPSVPTADIVPIKRTLEARPLSRAPWADRIDRELRNAGCYGLPSAA